MINISNQALNQKPIRPELDYTHGLARHVTFAVCGFYGQDLGPARVSPTVNSAPVQHGLDLEFDGTDDWFDYGTDKATFDTTKPCAVALRLNSDTMSSFEGALMLQMEGSVPLEIHPSNAASYRPLTFGANGGTHRINEAAAHATGEWIDYVILYDGVSFSAQSSWSIYRNGVSEGVTNSGGIGGRPNRTRVGAFTNGVSPFDGMIDYAVALVGVSSEAFVPALRPPHIYNLFTPIWQKSRALVTAGAAPPAGGGLGSRPLLTLGVGA